MERLHAFMRRLHAREDLESLLEEIADGITQGVGFGTCAINLLRDDGMIETVAVSGDIDVREGLLGRTARKEDFLRDFGEGDEWGILRFVPHERYHDWEIQSHIPDFEPIDHPDAWHPLDALYAPLEGPSGELVGLLSVDMPPGLVKPSAQIQQLLEMYAVQAGLAIVAADYRSQLNQQIRLGEALRAVMTPAVAELSLANVVEASLPPLLKGLEGRRLWLRIWDTDSGAQGGFWSLPEDPDLKSSAAELAVIADKLAHDCWARQDAVRIAVDLPAPLDVLSQAEVDVVLGYLASQDTSSTLFVPIGAGADCFGYVHISRAAQDPHWSELEVRTALEIGRDLGRTTQHARLFEREAMVINELRQLGDYKGRLVSTVSHELKNPLTAITGHLEMLESPDSPQMANSSLAAIGRNTRRLASMVEDLNLLWRVDDPNRPVVAVPVDLAGVLREAVELHSVHAELNDLEMVLRDRDASPVASGETVEIDRVVTNIVGNAVKYTPPGGLVEIDYGVDGNEVWFSCRDTGLGISESDQAELFTEFFRSRNVSALALPGTGLGLSIVKRIVDRHGGSIQVESELGKGSVFTVRLPRAA